MKSERIPMPAEMTGLPWSAQPWLGGETLTALAELNEQALSLIVEEARARQSQRPQPLLHELAGLWSKLDAAALKRAAACPYLLMDAGFADPLRWTWTQGRQVRERGPTEPFFTVPRAAAVMRTVLTYGWHLAQGRDSAARVLLGMSPRCVPLVAGCTLVQVADLAENHPAWLQPRWPTRVRVWRELLSAAITGEGAALERARLRGLQILAADARAGGAL